MSFFFETRRHVPPIRHAMGLSWHVDTTSASCVAPLPLWCHAPLEVRLTSPRFPCRQPASDGPCALPSCLWGVLLALCAALLLIVPTSALAEQMAPYITSDDYQDCTALMDSDFVTTMDFGPNTTITVQADEPIASLYVVWENVPGAWTLRAGSASMSCGTDGFLHEYVEIPPALSSGRVSLVVGEAGASIADIYAFSAGEVPDSVQRWKPSYDEADVLVVSTHSDDEVLFLGGVIPTYVDRGARVQVAYYTYPMPGEHHRNHEFLNGLWTMGVMHYPQTGEFLDMYSDSVDVAAEQYGHDGSLEYVVRTIRRFKPQVLVGQDVIAGEYGHGAHIWCARMLAEALDVTADASLYPDSAERYGTWNVPKTYFHLYPEGQLELDARVPLGTFGGRTCLDVLKEAFLKHVSQQYIIWTVQDAYDDYGNPNGYEYPCTQFGLYRSLVGPDTPGANDIMEHVVPYRVQDIARWITRVFLRLGEVTVQV